MRLVRAALLGVALLALGVPSGATAEEATTGASYAVTVSPVRLELSTDPGRSVVATVQVTNASTGAVTLAAEAADFVAQGEGGQPSFVPAEQSPWSMSNWVSSQPAEFSLKSGESKEVTVTIDVPKDAEPGGHYSAILFSSKPSAEGQTAVVAKVGTLMLLRVSGEVEEKGVVTLNGPLLRERGPVAFTVRFTNQGNVHVKPTGVVRVKRLWGSQVASLTAGNENVLPDSSRSFAVTWKDPPAGVYVVRTSVKYGSNEELATSDSRYLFVFPWKLVLAAIGIFVLGIVTSLLLRRKKA